MKKKDIDGELVRKLLSLGLSRKEIALKIDVHRNTLYKYLRDNNLTDNVNDLILEHGHKKQFPIRSEKTEVINKNESVNDSVKTDKNEVTSDDEIDLSILDEVMEKIKSKTE